MDKQEHAQLTSLLGWFDQEMRKTNDEEQNRWLDSYEKGMTDGRQRANEHDTIGELPEDEHERDGFRHGWLDQRNDPTDVLVYREGEVWWAYRDKDECLVGFSSWEELVGRYPDALDMEEDFSDMLKSDRSHYTACRRFFVVG
jgi:hypothetical protein